MPEDPQVVVEQAPERARAVVEAPVRRVLTALVPARCPRRRASVARVPAPPQLLAALLVPLDRKAIADARKRLQNEEARQVFIQGHPTTADAKGVVPKGWARLSHLSFVGLN